MSAYIGSSKNLKNLKDAVSGVSRLPYIGGNLFTPTCLSPLTLLTSVHWGRHLHVFGLTSEVTVVGAPIILTMGYHGPPADLLYPGVCASRAFPGLCSACHHERAKAKNRRSLGQRPRRWGDACLPGKLTESLLSFHVHSRMLTRRVDASRGRRRP